MATAVGTYATLAGVQARIGNATSGDATELQSFCNQVNAWIEGPGGAGRVLAPLPVIKTTLQSSVAAGATAITVASAGAIASLAVGDELALGPVTGTHESSPVLAINGAAVTLAIPLVNAYGSSAPVERVYMRDGFDATFGDDMVPGRVLIEERGVVVLTALEIAPVTRGNFGLVPATDYFLRPSPQRRTPGWPATEIVMTNIPSPLNTYPAFYPGFGNIREWGQMGWHAQPDDVVGLAERLVAALWTMKAGSGAYSLSPGTDVAQSIPHALSYDDWRTLKSYRPPVMEVVG